MSYKDKVKYTPKEKYTNFSQSRVKKKKQQCIYCLVSVHLSNLQIPEEEKS